MESKKLEDKTGLALSHRLLGETLSGRGLFPEAAENLETAEKIVTELGLIAEQAAAKAAWGIYYRAVGKANLAGVAWQEAIEIGQNLAPDVIWQAQAGLAELAIEAGRFEKALGHYREVVAALNRLREDMWQSALAGFFLERPIHTLEKAIQLAVNTDATEDTFYFIEASKAQVLAKQFKRPIVADMEDRSLELSNLVGEIRWRDEQIRGIKQGTNQLLLSELLRLQSELRHLVQEYENLRGRIERRNNTPNYKFLPDRTVLKAEDFKNAWNNRYDEGWVALDYYLTEKEGICICLSRESCKVFQLGFPSRARYIYESINRLTLTGKWDGRDLERLGQWLLPDEILEILSENKLLIIAPHRLLNYLPWSALTTDGRPLVSQSIPVLVPSLYSLMALMDRPISNSVPASGLLVAVSDFDGRHWPLASVIDEVEFLL
ncbi:MAG: hypothetical protein GWN62_17700, partial [Aliifodinibius sp.]|nr:hypothetical protein [Fodinibius sp.]